MHARALATLLLLVLGLRGSVASEETTINDSLFVNAAPEGKPSLPGGSQVLDGRAAWECMTEAGVQNCLDVEEGRTDSEDWEAKPRNIILGAVTDQTDDLSFTVGLDSMFNMGTFMTALLVMAAAMGVLGIGSGLFGGIYNGFKYYDRDHDDDFSSYPATEPLYYGHYQDTYASLRKLDEAQQTYGE